MFKKILSSALCLSMLLSTAVPAFAADITTDGETGKTVVSYGMDEGFLVVIPGDFNIVDKTATADVKAMDVMIGANKSLIVTIHGDDYVDKWEFIDQVEDSNRLEYIIGSSSGGSDIIDGSIVLAVDAGAAYDTTVTETLHFTVVDTLTKSGTYDDTLTFEARITSSVLEGNGQTFYKAAPSNLNFRSLEPLDEFEQVLVNGQPLDPSNYTLTEGSTIVTLGIDYLNSLGGSVYDIEIVSEKKSGSAQFGVVEGDWNSQVGFWYDKPYVMAGWGMGLGVMFNKDGTLYAVGFDLSSNVYDIQKHPYTIKNGVVEANIDGVIYVAQGTEDENILSVYTTDAPDDLMEFWHYEKACVSEGEYFYAEPWAAWTGELEDYDAQVLDRDKTSYRPILTGVNNVVVQTNGTYRDCVNLKEILIPYGITFIGDDCFENCVSLEKVTLPASITEIYSTAFTDCSSLSEIKFYGTMEQWNNINKGSGWNADISATQVICSDGVVEI